MLDDTLVAFLTISINLEIYLRQLTISLSILVNLTNVSIWIWTLRLVNLVTSQQNNKRWTVGFQCLQNMIFRPHSLVGGGGVG